MHFYSCFKKFVVSTAAGLAGLFLFGGVAQAMVFFSYPSIGQEFEVGYFLDNLSGDCDRDGIRIEINKIPDGFYEVVSVSCADGLFNTGAVGLNINQGAGDYNLTAYGCNDGGCGDVDWGDSVQRGIVAVAASGGGGWAGQSMIPISAANTAEVTAVIGNFFTDIWNFLIVILAFPVAFIIIRGIVLWFRNLR